MWKYIERYVDIGFLKEDVRKLGINFVTAGNVGLFITHIAGLTLLLVAASVWVIMSGIGLLVFGLYQKEEEED